MNAGNPHSVPDQLPELLGLLTDVVRSKATMVDAKKVLAGRKADLARQQEKTPDFPAAWQSIQRGVKVGEKELSRVTKEYQQLSERFISVVSQLYNPVGDFIANVVRDASPERRTRIAPSDALPGAPTGPKAMQNTDIKPIEARLVELEKKHQSMDAQTASELQALQAAMKAVTTEHQELREKDKAMSQREKAVDDLLEEHKNLVAEHHSLGERCAKLEAQNKELLFKNSEFEKQLESNREPYEELDKKTDRSQRENKKLQEDFNELKARLDRIVKEQSLSEDRHQKVSTLLRANFRTLSENHDKVLMRLSNVEKRVTTVEDTIRKVTKDLEGIATSVESGLPDKALTFGKMSADITEKVSQATAGLSSDLETVIGLVQSHQELLNEFEPGELDKLWWTVPKIKEESDRLKEQISALEKRHEEFKAEIQNGKQSTGGGTLRDTSAPAPPRTPTPSSVVGNSQHILNSDTIRKAEEAVKRVGDLKKAQDGIIRGIGGMIDKARAEVKNVEKGTGAELASIKDRLDVLEKNASEGNGNPTDTGLNNDLADMNHKLCCLTDQHSSLDRFVRESLRDYSDRLYGLQQLYLDWQHHTTNTSTMPSPSIAAIPNHRPPAHPDMVRRTSSFREAKRAPKEDMNGSVKRRRMESAHQNGTPPERH